MKKTNDKNITQEPVESETEDWKSKYLRALADYQNLEKRVAQSRHDERQSASEGLLRKILPVLDTLEKAQQHLGDQGLGLAIREFWNILEREGVSKIKTSGREFDPYEMEAIEVAEGEDGKVIEELIPGYMLHERILRVAKVKVGKSKLENTKVHNLNDKSSSKS